MTTIDVKTLGIIANNDNDNTLKLFNILKELNSDEPTVINFDEGVYHFYPNYAFEKMLHISNHDDGLRRIAFPLINKKNLKIQGNNAKFIFHTDIIPFYLHECENVDISGITIDFNVPGYSEADILEVNDKELVLHISNEKYPHKIVNNKLIFTGENIYEELHNCLEMDPTTWGPAYNTTDMYWSSYPHIKYEDLGNDKIKVSFDSYDSAGVRRTLKAGNKLILRNHERTHPAIYVTDGKNISLRDVTVHHATGMGFIAEHTKDIILENFNVKVDENNKRIFTTTADATHFVYCYGQIKINNCLFENQLDDPVNIHGIYGQINKVISSTEIVVKLVEQQQKGVRLGKVGERLSLVNNSTLLSYGESIIKEINMLNRHFTYIKLETPIEGIEAGHVIENLEYVPDVEITNCIFRNNRARGLLLTSAGNVLVKNNFFDIPGAAILIEGDANYWFESGATKNIVLENNVFHNCAYVQQWGWAPIQVSPKTSKIVDGLRYHKSLTINNNEFHCFDDRLICADNVETIIFTNNKIVKTNTFAPLGNNKFVLNNVINFIEHENVEE